MSSVSLQGTKYKVYLSDGRVDVLDTGYDNIPEQSSCDLLRIGMTVELRCALFPC